MKALAPVRATELIFGADVRACAQCAQPTFWRTPRQPKKGLCPDHATWVEPTEQEWLTAFTTLIRAFPTAVVSEFAPTVMAPDVYGRVVHKLVLRGQFVTSGIRLYVVAPGPPLDAGPCEGCRRTVRRYGPLGHPTCSNCERSTT